MSDYLKIEKNIPIPPTTSGRRNNGTTAMMRQMETGDSFLTKYKKTQAVGGLVRALRPMRFVCRTTSEGVRVWRIA